MNWESEEAVARATLQERECMRRELQTAIDEAQDDGQRNAEGQFATPPELARHIAACARAMWPESLQVDFCDPAIGTGVFFGALCETFPREGIVSASGIEVNERIARAAHDVWAPLDLHVVHGDFMEQISRAHCPQRPNLILTNPPYVRHHHIPAQRKAELQSLVAEMTGLRVNGLAGFYVYYLMVATEWMRDDGLGVWLIPSEFMDVNYGEVLRRYLTCSATLLRVHRFDSSECLFDDALVTSSVVFLRKSRPTGRERVHFTSGPDIRNPTHRRSMTLERLRASDKWTSAAFGAAGHGASKETDTPCLGDLFVAKRGIATGANAFFVMERREAQRLGLPPAMLRPILPSPRYLSATVLEADEAGYPTIEPQLCLLDCRLPESQVSHKYPALWAYLESGVAKGLPDRYLCQRRSPWYRQEDRDPPLFFCTYMGRPRDGAPLFRFIWNRSQAIAANVYLLLYPRPWLAALLAGHRELEAALFDALQAVSDAEMVASGRTYGGGLHKLEPGELAALRLDLRAGSACAASVESIVDGARRASAQPLTLPF